jgi:uncharacterized membrane protein (DUF373 family)
LVTPPGTCIAAWSPDHHGTSAVSRRVTKRGGFSLTGDPMQSALRRFIGDTLYETFEHLVMLVLTILIVLMIAFATWHLALETIGLIVAGKLDPTDPEIYPDLFAIFFTILIGLEFKRSFLLVSSTQTNVVRIRSLILIGMLATLRKFILLDLREIQVGETAAVAGAILALGVVFWLVRDNDQSPGTTSPPWGATSPEERQDKAP